MQFEHMEVGLAGTNRKQEIGPFSSGLNVVSGRPGSGKSRLIGWLRQMIAESGVTPHGVRSVDRYSDHHSDYYHSQGTKHYSPSSAAGTLNLRNRGVAMRIAQSADGLRTMRGEAGVLTNRQRQAFSLLCSTGDLADCTLALDDVAVQLGLDVRSEDRSASQRARLIARENELLTNLENSSTVKSTREELLSRRRDIEHRLDQIRQQTGSVGNGLATSPHFRLDQYAAIDADLNGATAEIELCERQIAEVEAELRLCEIGKQQLTVDHSYREQLQQLEDRLNRWRQTLRDIKIHRDSIEHDETDARLDEQAGMQLSGNLYPDARGSMRSLESQLHNARKHLDQLVRQYASNGSASAAIPSYHGAYSVGQSAPGYTVTNGQADSIGQAGVGGIQVQRKADGGARIELDSRPLAYLAPDHLPDVLRSMQKDLHEVCHHLSRYEAHSAAQALKQQVSQLRRCERELLQSVEKLVEERGQLLSRIAAKYNLSSDQVSLTFGDWCQCSDHEHLHEWLLKEDDTRKARVSDGLDRTRLTDNLARLQAQRKEAVLRAEECRRQLRELERGRPTNQSREANPSLQLEEGELLRELDTNIKIVVDLETRERMRVELDDIRHQIARLPQTPINSSEYLDLVNRHILGLTNSLFHDIRATQPGYLVSHQYDSVNGVITEQPSHRRQMEVPRSIVNAAQWLAIASLLASRGDTIPVVLDQTLDGLSPEAIRFAVNYLSQVSQRFQIILLTDNWAVVDAVRERRGQLLTLGSLSAETVPDVDVNSVLTSLANEQEADKWYRPAVEPVERSRLRQYYLSRYSRVDELPMIPQVAADRCRNLGIDSVGDLLDANPQQLALDLRLQSVSESTVRNWQSVAVLLCSVRGLRPFDARVLVGAGVRSAQTLSSLHPTQLLERVERFLTTEIGRRILRSGNNYELSRITSWIASAKSGAVRSNRDLDPIQLADDNHNQRDTGKIMRLDRGHHLERHAVKGDAGSRSESRRRRTNPRQDKFGLTDRRRNREGRVPDHDTSGSRTQSPSPRGPRNVHSKLVPERENSSSVPVRSNGRRDSDNVVNSLRFYLELSSPVVDAPSIGRNIGERLNQCGVYTVEELLAATSESLARKLSHPRATAQVIRDWQDQARLVCRIPNLRGHDAQLLVACKITTPESLATMNAEAVLDLVLAFSGTRQGQKVLHGGNQPDLAEVRNWISWANQCRSLSAA